MPLVNTSAEPDCWKALPSWGPEPAAPAGLTWQGLMRRALRLARAAARAGEIPVGALVVGPEGEILSEAHNETESLHDPTAHAEVEAIRNACRELGTFDLKGCTVYSSCEPCPMCLSALYWAGIERICYANTKRDAAAIDFDDSFIYDQLRLDYDRRSIHCEHFMRDEALEAFRKWNDKTDKVEY